MGELCGGLRLDLQIYHRLVKMLHHALLSLKYTEVLVMNLGGLGGCHCSKALLCHSHVDSIGGGAIRICPQVG